jgi:uncharacterized membrane protein
VRIVLIVLSLCGIIVSALALQVHYSTGTEPCSINAHWDCGIVNHSLYSVIYGVPVALVGILGHAFLEILVLSRRKALFFLTTLGGVGYPGYLSHIEGQVLGVWCIYCVTSASILVLLMLLGGGWLLSGRSTAAKHRFSASMFGSAPTASDLKTSARNIFPPSSLS